MPTVPRLDPTLQQQAFKPTTTNPTAPIEAFGGGEGFRRVTDASNRMVNTFGQIVQEERNRADKVAVDAADANTLRYKNDLFWDDKQGAITRKGKNAFGAMEEYGQKFDDFADGIEDGLSGDNQKALFREKRMERKNELLDQLSKHTYGEISAYENEVRKTKRDAISDDVIRNFQEDKKVTNSIDELHRLVDEDAAANGHDANWVELEKRRVSGKTYGDVIERMLDLGDDRAAKVKFNEYKNQMDGDSKTRIEKALRAGTLKGESFRVADELYNQHGATELAFQKAQKHAGDDAELREAIESRLKAMKGNQEFARKSAVDGNFQKALNSVKAFPDKLVIDAVETSVYKNLDSEQIDALNKINSNTEHNSKKWLGFIDLAMTNPKALESMDINEFHTKYYAHFDESRRKEAQNLWSKAREGKLGDKYSPLLSKEKMILNAAVEVKLGGIESYHTLNDIKKDSEKGKAYTEFQQEANARYRQLHLEKGKEPSPEEFNKLLNDLKVKVIVHKPGVIYGTTKVEKFRYQVKTPEEKALTREDIGKIPDQFKRKMFLDGKSSGIIPNNITYDQAVIKYRDKFERAFGQSKYGPISKKDVLSILGSQN